MKDMKASKFLKANKYLIVVLLFVAALSSCNSNDNEGEQQIQLSGVTLDGDQECCSADEAILVRKFLYTVKPIPELSFAVGDKYTVSVYSKTGTFHVGYNELFFLATKNVTGNYVKDVDINNLIPLMYMAKMDVHHSAPASTGAESFDESILAVKRAWVSFIMDGEWTIGYDARVSGSKESFAPVSIHVDALPEGQKWVQSFKAGGETYYLSLVNPTDWKTGSNTITAYVSQKSTSGVTPYQEASEEFTVDIDPRMPDMGFHTSPDNVSLTYQQEGLYAGTINLTMTGLWRIYLTIRDSKGNVVAGGDNTNDGFSSLYWDVTI